MTLPADDLPWQMPSPRTVLEAIETWRLLDMLTATDDAVRDQLRLFLNKIEYFAPARLRIQGMRTVYRARFVTKRQEPQAAWPWNKRADLLYPPRGVAQRQRCNTPGESVLYCAKDIITCLREQRPSCGDQVVIASYQVRDASLSVVVPQLKLDSLEGKPLFDKDGAVSFLILREFIRSEFTKPVGVGTEFLYKLSNAMCEVLFDDEDNDGWIYPSVESSSHECIAFKPTFVDSDNLALKSADRFDVLAEQHRAFVVQRTHTAQINEHGITWQPKADAPRWVAPKREAGAPPLVWPLPG